MILKEGKNIIVVCDDELSSSNFIQGYGFFTHNGECVCEFIYYFDDLCLEVFDLSEGETCFYVNTFIYDIEEILEEKFYWGDL